MLRAGICTVTFVALFLARPALCAEPEKARADALFHDGVVAANAGDYESARKLFAASNALFPRGTAIGNLGEAEVRLGDVVSGLRHLRAAVALLDDTDPRRETFRRDLDDAYARTGHIEIKAVAGSLILVDGAVVDGRAPLVEAVDVLPGTHEVECRAGVRAGKASVNAPANVVTTVDLTSAQEQASLVPAAPAPVSVEPQPASVPRLDEPPPARVGSWWTPPRIAGAALGGVAIVAAVTAAGFHAAGSAAAKDSATARGTLGASTGICTAGGWSPGCNAVQADVGRVHDMNEAARASWIVTGVAAGGAAVAFVWGALVPASRHLHPAVGLGSVGVVGEF